MKPNGFTMIGIALLLPILFLVGTLTFFYFELITNYSWAQKQCREHVLKAQQILGEHLKKLIDLNPVAQKLRAEQKRLEVAIAISPPQARPFLEAMLRKNEAQQMILAVQQRNIIASGKARAQMALGTGWKNVNQHEIALAKLEVKTSPVWAIAPDYYPVDNFAQAQTIRIGWRALGVGPTYKKFLKENLENISGDCSATLKKGGLAWNPQINEAKFLLNVP